MNIAVGRDREDRIVVGTDGNDVVIGGSAGEVGGVEDKSLAPEKLPTFDSNNVEVAKESLLMMLVLEKERLPVIARL